MNNAKGSKTAILAFNSQARQRFSSSMGVPTKELYSMAGLVFLADFFNWSAVDATQAYLFRTDVQSALNLEPGPQVSSRTVERYQKLFREDEAAAQVFDEVTARLARPGRTPAPQITNQGATALPLLLGSAFLPSIRAGSP